MMADRCNIDESPSRVSRKGGRRTFRSLDNSGGVGGSDAFLRHNPHARPPAEHAVVAPSRHDVPRFDPCCGQLSAGAEARLGTKLRRSFIEFDHVASGLRVPSGLGDRPQTPRGSAALTPDMADDKAWNSRKISDAAFRAKRGAGTSAVKMRAVASARTPHTAGVLLEEDIGMQDPLSSDTRLRLEDRVRRYVYTSSTQRAYEEVNWDAMLPRRLKAPPTTLEKKADPVAWCSSTARYPSGPQPWQSIGDQWKWDRQQIRPRNVVQKPVSFCSPKTGQIPLYSGFIGSENKDNIDNKDEHFQPTTLLRTTTPQYTPTARRTTIPGYMGKAVYANADVSLPTVSLQGLMALRPPAFGHKGPLSKMVTITSPYNPFRTPKPCPALPMRCGWKNK